MLISRGFPPILLAFAAVSGTVLFVVRRLMERDAERPCVCLGFGPGLVAEAALLG